MLAALFILWIIFNGRVTLDVLLSGAVLSVVLFLLSCRFTGHSLQKEKLIYREAPYILRYFCLLVVEIIKSTGAVLVFVIRRDRALHPKLVRFRTPLRTKIGRVMLANSITLTPGTITASLEGDLLTVHCLDSQFGDGIEDSSFQKLLLRMEEVSGV